MVASQVAGRCDRGGVGWLGYLGSVPSEEYSDRAVLVEVEGRCERVVREPYEDVDAGATIGGALELVGYEVGVVGPPMHSVDVFI